MMKMNNYTSPKTKEEYWNIVNLYWKDIRFILDLYLPTFKKQYIDLSPLNSTLGEYIEELKVSRNPRIARVFNAAFWNIPETIPTNEISSYAQFYDLCTKEYRLYEDFEQEN
jgi:hypothetical protein